MKMILMKQETFPRKIQRLIFVAEQLSIHQSTSAAMENQSSSIPSVYQDAVWSATTLRPTSAAISESSPSIPSVYQDAVWLATTQRPTSAAIARSSRYVPSVFPNVA